VAKSCMVIKGEENAHTYPWYVLGRPTHPWSTVDRSNKTLIYNVFWI